MATAAVIDVEYEARLQNLESGNQRAKAMVEQTRAQIEKSSKLEMFAGGLSGHLVKELLGGAIALHALKSGIELASAGIALFQGKTDKAVESLERLPIVGRFIVRPLKEMYDLMAGTEEKAKGLEESTKREVENLKKLEELRSENKSLELELGGDKAGAAKEKEHKRFDDELREAQKAQDASENRSRTFQERFSGGFHVFSANTKEADKAVDEVRLGLERIEETRRKHANENAKLDAEETKRQADTIREIADIKRKTKESDRKSAVDSIKANKEEMESETRKFQHRLDLMSKLDLLDADHASKAQHRRERIADDAAAKNKASELRAFDIEEQNRIAALRNSGRTVIAEREQINRDIERRMHDATSNRERKALEAERSERLKEVDRGQAEREDRLDEIKMENKAIKLDALGKHDEAETARIRAKYNKLIAEANRTGQGRLAKELTIREGLEIDAVKNKHGDSIIGHELTVSRTAFTAPIGQQATEARRQSEYLRQIVRNTERQARHTLQAAGR